MGDFSRFNKGKRTHANVATGRPRVFGFDTDHLHNFRPFSRTDTGDMLRGEYDDFDRVRAAVCELAQALYEVW